MRTTMTMGITRISMAAMTTHHSHDTLIMITIEPTTTITPMAGEKGRARFRRRARRAFTSPGLSQERIVRIERDILCKNNAYARENRARF